PGGTAPTPTRAPRSHPGPPAPPHPDARHPTHDTRRTTPDTRRTTPTTACRRHTPGPTPARVARRAAGSPRVGLTPRPGLRRTPWSGDLGRSRLEIRHHSRRTGRRTTPMATDHGQGDGYGYGPSHGLGSAPGHRGTAERRHRLPAALRAPVEGRSWRELGYVLLSLPISIMLFTYAVTMVSLGAGLLVTFLGVPVLAAALAGCRGIGAVERARARALLDLEVDEPEPLRMRKPGAMAWMGAVLKSGTSWRALLYSLLQMPWSVFTFTVSVTFWSIGWTLLTYP